ncbi:hypothetical protein AMTRI_Chr09g39600 [Amborella trichopoda]
MAIKLQSVLVLLIFMPSLLSMAHEETSNGSSSSVHIVYMERTEGEPEGLHLKTLASIFGSEEAAKDAIIYTYKNTINGFSARLTPQQVAELKKQAGVLQVLPSTTYQLHSRAHFP